MKNKKNILVLGLGNFGYSILSFLDNNINYSKYNIYGWDRKKDLMNSLKNDKTHTIFHKDHKISNNIIFNEDLANVLKDIDILILAITSNSIIDIINEYKNFLKKDILILNTAKALSKNGNVFSKEIETILNNLDYGYGIISGGTIATDLFEGYPLGITIGLSKMNYSKEIRSIFNKKSNLFVEISNDLIGVEYSGIFKNIGSILIGYIHGKGYPTGTETFYLTQFHKEIKDILVKNLKIKKKTFSFESQCWGNDLILSTTGNTRNKEFGVLLGQGIPFNESIQIMIGNNKTIEGLNTLQFLEKFILNLNIDIKKYKILNELLNIYKTGNFILPSF